VGGDNMSEISKLDNPILQKRIAILGGTFDPIHYAHLRMAEVVKDEGSLDEVWFMPAKVPPHKQDKEISMGEDRIAMLRLAIDSIPYFKLSLIEFEREGPSYTVDTVRELTNRYPHNTFFFIIGADMVEYLPHWHQIKELMKLVTFIAVDRPGWNLKNLTPEIAEEVVMVDMLPSYTSSTRIRKRKKERKSIRFLVPEEVYRYIEEKRLYE
jgi:nicotinate-nucleotide adenylyltransferase